MSQPCSCPPPPRLAPIPDPVTRVFARVMYDLRGKERQVQAEVAHRPDGPLSREEARRFRMLNQIHQNPYYGNSMGYLIGGPAPMMGLIKASVINAVRTVGGGQVCAREGRFSPGAVGEGWHMLLHRRPPGVAACPDPVVRAALRSRMMRR